MRKLVKRMATYDIAYSAMAKYIACGREKAGDKE
jgi:hypothetical protein